MHRSAKACWAKLSGSFLEEVMIQEPVALPDHVALAKTLWTEETAIPNWRLMARMPMPFAFNASTSLLRLSRQVTNGLQ
jgi:hypothetical protein